MALSVMSTASACDELRRLIHKTHLSYLNRDDTPDKLDHKTKLEALILEYLSIVSNSHKFCHVEVAECLSESVTRNPNFSAYKAAIAFEVVEKFAVNLLMKPWRKEFRVICPYSGFYKHTVEKQLYGSEYLLYLMGYKRKHFPHSVIDLTEAPLDPDRLASIALDCLIAFVECQIMIQVYDILKRKGYSVTWVEIHEIRSKYICGMDDVIRFIIDRKRSCKLIDLDEFTPTLSSKYATHVCRGSYSNNCWQLPEHSSLSKRNFVNYPNETNLCNDSLSRIDSYDLMHFPVENPQTHSNSVGNCCSLPLIPYLTPPAPPMFSVVYSEDSNDRPTSLSKPNKVNKGIQAGSSLDTLSASLGQLNVKLETTRLPDPIHQCDSQTVVTKKNDFSKLTKMNSNVLDHSLDVVDASSFDTKSRTLEKCSKKFDMKKPNTITVSSKCENSKTIAKATKGAVVQKGNQGAAKVCLPVSVECSTKSTSKSIEPIWSCSSCTYLNTVQRDICEMCSRSKERGSENVPLVSGGKECPRCTLVNDKNIDYCTACETNLIDSPTYI
ncbi:uncharacterized protein B4U80_09515 [Leptotrombidium deliense]|uniref:RanBP2-type domain-containing protein n=1 Tax=Leptotrombidium deliense TaxID=299467 RepID=A0A443SQM8_9ACAR|nr:uncharacterized protein B4U80_09515 [Leptotrombidium deliense]